MPNPNYTSGARAERAVKQAFEARGALVVRSAGSKGKVDLVAIRPDSVWAIQVKTAKPTPQELAALGKARKEYGGLAQFAMLWYRRGKFQFIDGAEPALADSKAEPGRRRGLGKAPD